MVRYVAFGLAPNVCYVATRFQKVVMIRFHDKGMADLLIYKSIT